MLFGGSDGYKQNGILGDSGLKNFDDVVSLILILGL